MSTSKYQICVEYESIFFYECKQKHCGGFIKSMICILINFQF